MPITLPPDLEARLAAEAAREGVSPDDLVVGVVKQHLEAEDLERRRAAKRDEASALLRSWREGDDEDDQRDVAQHLIEHLDKTRRENGERLLFPPEKKGQTW